MPNRLGKFGLPVRSVRRLLSVRAAGLGLGLAALMASGPGFAAGQDQAAGPAGAGEGAALSACAESWRNGVAVAYDPAENLFLSTDGTRYYASELRRAPPDAVAAVQSATYGGEDGTRLAAVPLGPANRWGLVPAWIVMRTGSTGRLWQARQLEEGFAVFAPEYGASACADALRGAEGRARRAGAGIWRRDGAGRIYSADRPESFKDAGGHYVIVRGRIVSLGKTSRTRYLNFGKYWKTDVTGTVKTADEEVFNAVLDAGGWALDTLAGRFVELRGIVEHRDGPHIALRHPEQLVVLEDKRAGRDGQGKN